MGDRSVLLLPGNWEAGDEEIPVSSKVCMLALEQALADVGIILEPASDGVLQANPVWEPAAPPTLAKLNPFISRRSFWRFFFPPTSKKKKQKLTLRRLWIFSFRPLNENFYNTNSWIFIYYYWV